MAGVGGIKREMEPETTKPAEKDLRAERAQVPLIFEQSVPGRRGVDLPPRRFQTRPAVDLIGAGLMPRGPRRVPRNERAPGDAPLPAPFSN